MPEKHKRKCFKCGSSSAEPGVFLYRFPKPGVKNVNRCESWARYCLPDSPWSSQEFQQKLYSEHRMLCHKHFKPTSFLDYETKSLHRHAVPDPECDEMSYVPRQLPVMTDLIIESTLNKTLRDITNKGANESAIQVPEQVQVQLANEDDFIPISSPAPSAITQTSKEDFVSESYQEKYGVTRKSIFSTITGNDINYFKSVLSDERVLTNESDVLPYNIDWLKNCRGQSTVVLKPKTTQEVSKILAYCNDKRLAVCPQGGNTGLVGGSVPVFDEIVINMMLMNKIINLDTISGALVCESGCILENLDNYVREHNLIIPLDLGAKGSCQIGGNVSTNAGGLRLLRYGNLHGTVLGLEAVKADGTVIDCLRTLKKDNTGYHLKHLFIGSEGTLGVVTKVAIHCPAAPKAVSLGMFGLKNFEDILELYKSAKSSLGEILSAFEMADKLSITSAVKHLGVTNPIPDYPFYVIMETHGSDEAHDSEKLTRFLTKEMESGLILDGTVTSEPGKVKAIWGIREGIPQATLAAGYMFKYDVSVPLNTYYDLVFILQERLKNREAKVFGYGHIGDGNIHINVAVPEYSHEDRALLEPFVYEEVAKLQGSVSAEHGVGFRKPLYIHYTKDKSAVDLMRVLKSTMDPNGILNPYKVLPD